MNIKYILMRIIRRILPNILTRFMIKNNIIIKSGIETSQPEIAVKRYCKILKKNKIDIKDKNIMIFGFGGCLAVAQKLIGLGATKIYLYDKYIQYVTKGDGVLKNKDSFELIENFESFVDKKEHSIDICISSSVFEHIHIKEIKQTLYLLAKVSSLQSIHCHFIDLRDHYFSYPFEMLCYSPHIWNCYLNPPDHLNRLRLNDYLNIFVTFFKKVTYQIIASNRKAFRQTKKRIRQEFISGNDILDSATEVVLIAFRPDHDK